MYLVDTNIWLERLLGQAKSNEVGLFLGQIPYAAAEQNNLIIVSFDSDLNKTPKGRKTPAEILKTATP
jgi:predicted nucleic acid-binding protein